eukprot:TRINITY_DN11092_c0_g1_i1.p1 TRINITY_DN11092_c0_g1~~TRINITY_DN11092_c0_g1_i1.p1  ORF type:complete len:826 (+),score=254.69 TRINITY_DN11092_c0_g1_i1:82-2478(+)
MPQQNSAYSDPLDHKWKSPNPKISVPDVCLADGNLHVFKIVIDDADKSWSLYKRYSVIRTFHDKLKAKFWDVKLPPFPPKSFFGEGLAFLSDRRIKLEIFFKTIFNNRDLLNSEEMRYFLAPRRSEYKITSIPSAQQSYISYPPNSMLYSSQPAAPRIINATAVNSNRQSYAYIPPQSQPQFQPQSQPRAQSVVYQPPSQSEQYPALGSAIPLLTPQPTHLRMPDSVVLANGEEILLSFLLDSIKDSIEHVSILEMEISGAVVPASCLNILDNSSTKLASNVSALRESLSTISMLMECHQLSNPEIRAYLDNCSRQIRVALDWNQKLQREIIPKIMQQEDAKRRAVHVASQKQEVDIDDHPEVIVEISERFRKGLQVEPDPKTNLKSNSTRNQDSNSTPIPYESQAPFLPHDDFDPLGNSSVAPSNSSRYSKPAGLSASAVYAAPIAQEKKKSAVTAEQQAKIDALYADLFKKPAVKPKTTPDPTPNPTPNPTQNPIPSPIPSPTPSPTLKQKIESPYAEIAEPKPTPHDSIVYSFESSAVLDDTPVLEEKFAIADRSEIESVTESAKIHSEAIPEVNHSQEVMPEIEAAAVPLTTSPLIEPEAVEGSIQQQFELEDRLCTYEDTLSSIAATIDDREKFNQSLEKLRAEIQPDTERISRVREFAQYSDQMQMILDTISDLAQKRATKDSQAKCAEVATSESLSEFERRVATLVRDSSFTNMSDLAEVEEMNRRIALLKWDLECYGRALRGCDTESSQYISLALRYDHLHETATEFEQKFNKSKFYDVFIEQNTDEQWE